MRMYNIGDTVRIINTNFANVNKGDIGIITRVPVNSASHYAVFVKRLADSPNSITTWFFQHEHLELVKSKKQHKYYLSYVHDGIDKLATFDSNKDLIDFCNGFIEENTKSFNNKESFFQYAFKGVAKKIKTSPKFCGFGDLDE